jgi:methylated-DNA-[protein]-cysteine S-methyltransferase
MWELARHIPPGSTRSYLELALELQQPHAARAVGQALGRNPFPIVVPCHRVLAAGGQSGGFSAPGGVRTKLTLLEIEGTFAAGPDRLI